MSELRLPDPPEPVALDVRRPFTRAEAVAHGLTDSRLRGPAFRQVFRNVHLGAQVPLTPRLRAEAALLLHPPGAFLSHSSAARMLGLPAPHDPDEHVTVLDPRHRRRRPGVRSHLSASGSALVRLDGLRLSSYARVFVELAQAIGLVDLVAVGDHLVRHQHLTPRQLVEFCTAVSLPGCVAARRAAAYVRPAVDSPMESRLRMLLVLGGLPEPEVNLVIQGEDGFPLRRYDLAYPRARTAIEYDGRHHVERVDQWERDLQRRESVDDSDWRLMVMTGRDLFRQPDRTLERVHRVLLSRGHPGVRRQLSDRWRAHFPTHR